MMKKLIIILFALTITGCSGENNKNCVNETINESTGLLIKVECEVGSNFFTGLVDEKGDYFLDTKYTEIGDATQTRITSNDFYVLHSNTKYIRVGILNDSGELKYGIIDRSKKYLLEPIYDEVLMIEDSDLLYYVYDDTYYIKDIITGSVSELSYKFHTLKDDYIITSKDGKKYIMDMNFSLMKNEYYDDILQFDDHRFIYEKDGFLSIEVIQSNEVYSIEILEGRKYFIIDNINNQLVYFVEDDSINAYDYVNNIYYRNEEYIIEHLNGTDFVYKDSSNDLIVYNSNMVRILEEYRLVDSLGKGVYLGEKNNQYYLIGNEIDKTFLLDSNDYTLDPNYDLLDYNYLILTNSSHSLYLDSNLEEIATGNFDCVIENIDEMNKKLLINDQCNLNIIDNDYKIYPISNDYLEDFRVVAATEKYFVLKADNKYLLYDLVKKNVVLEVN